METRSRLCSNRELTGVFERSAYLINHLRIPGGVPNEECLSYLEHVERMVKAFGGKWLAQVDVQVVEGARPGSVDLMAAGAEG